MEYTRRGTAIHEAGHFIVGAFANPPEKFYTIRVRPRDGRGGYVRYYTDRPLDLPVGLQEYGLFALGGAVAQIMDEGERINLDSLFCGSEQDMQDYFRLGGKKLAPDAATLDDTVALIGDILDVGLGDIEECVRRLRKNWALAKYFQKMVCEEGRVQFNTQATQALVSAVEVK